MLGDEHPQTLVCITNLAGLYSSQGRFAEAEPLYLETLETQRRVLGDEHPDTLLVMGNLALLYRNQGRYEEAGPLHLETLEIQRRVLGDEHPDTLGSITNLGILYNNAQRFDEAAEMLETSLPILRRVRGMEHPWTSEAMRALVTAYQGLERFDEALPLQRELLELQTAAADRPGADALVLHDAAWTLLTIEPEGLQDRERALGYAERACALAEVSSPDDLWALLSTLAIAQYLTGDTPAAVETQRRALALMPEGADPTMVPRLAEFEAALEGE